MVAHPGAGPRHLAFSVDDAHLFVVNELDNSLAAYTHEAGRFEIAGVASTLPPGAESETAADLHVVDDRVFVSNRGHNSIASFRFGEATDLELIGVVGCGGDWPRGFGVSPSRSHVVVANRRSNEIVMLAMGPDGIPLSEPVVRYTVVEPSCVVFG